MKKIYWLLCLSFSFYFPCVIGSNSYDLADDNWLTIANFLEPKSKIYLSLVSTRFYKIFNEDYIRLEHLYAALNLYLEEEPKPFFTDINITKLKYLDIISGKIKDLADSAYQKNNQILELRARSVLDSSQEDIMDFLSHVEQIKYSITYNLEGHEHFESLHSIYNVNDLEDHLTEKPRCRIISSQVREKKYLKYGIIFCGATVGIFAALDLFYRFNSYYGFPQEVYDDFLNQTNVTNFLQEPCFGCEISTRYQPRTFDHSVLNHKAYNNSHAFSFFDCSRASDLIKTDNVSSWIDYITTNARLESSFWKKPIEALVDKDESMVKAVTMCKRNPDNKTLDCGSIYTFGRGSDVEIRFKKGNPECVANNEFNMRHTNWHIGWYCSSISAGIFWLIYFALPVLSFVNYF
jgi:hypothetical protein